MIVRPGDEAVGEPPIGRGIMLIRRPGVVRHVNKGLVRRGKAIGNRGDKETRWISGSRRYDLQVEVVDVDYVVADVALEVAQLDATHLSIGPVQNSGVGWLILGLQRGPGRPRIGGCILNSLNSVLDVRLYGHLKHGQIEMDTLDVILPLANFSVVNVPDM